MKTQDQELFEILVLNHVGFSGKWEGWRMAGEFLISPDGLRLRQAQLVRIFQVQGETKRPKKRLAGGPL